MSQASVTFQLGNESVTATLDIDLGAVVNPISGNLAGLIGNAHIVGDINLTGNVYSEGLLTGIDTFHVQGNGFTWFFQNGGQADLHGKPKAAWGEWGTDTTGWVAGDRLAVAPTKAGVYVPTEMTWTGSWATMTRPVNSPDVTLIDGSVRKPEVVNLSQTIVLENLARGFHFHDSAGVQSLSDVKSLNCGTTGILGNYPIHFHQLYENSRGSFLERVVVEGGKNHAFVPHGSHGITFEDCVAYNTANLAYWWDQPDDNSTQFDPNETNDAFYDHCLAMLVTENMARQDGFHLGRGTGNRCIDSVATCVNGGAESSGFQWPEVGIGVWEFRDCVSHNNKALGIFTWQNSSLIHPLNDFHGYRNGLAGIKHGAYGNFYHYKDIVLSENPTALIQHAVTRSHVDHPDDRLIFEDFLTDGPLLIVKHNTSGVLPTIYRRCTFTGVTYNEINAGKSSYNVFEDCGLVPSDFTFTLIQSASVIEVLEAGVLTHRWASGVWT